MARRSTEKVRPSVKGLHKRYLSHHRAAHSGSGHPTIPGLHTDSQAPAGAPEEGGGGNQLGSTQRLKNAEVRDWEPQGPEGRDLG